MLFYLVPLTLLLSFSGIFVTVNSFYLKRVVVKDDTTGDFQFDYMDNLLTNLCETLTEKKNLLVDPELWPEDYAHEALKHGLPVYDYIVVGAGSAGSVVASRLSEDPNVKVLVLEAGGDPPLFSEIHALSMLLLNTSYTWYDYAEPNPSCCQGLRDGRCYWPRGKMIGGSGGVNGNVFLQGAPQDFDEWQQQGNANWSWENVSPFFLKATQDLSGEPVPMGSLTINHFQRLENYHILSDLMQAATDEYESEQVTKSQGYLPNVTVTVDRGTRMSTGKTYLGRVARKRNNLHVIKNSVATKVTLNNKKLKATGVEFLINGSKRLRAQARREVIVSAGAFNSPKLLLLSGIGPRKQLMKLNIRPLKNLQVGQNFQDHGMMPLILRFSKNIPEMHDEITLQSVFDYFMHQDGALATSSTLIGLVNTLHQNKSDIMLVSQITKPTKESNTFDFLQFKEELVDRFLQQIENHTVLQIEGLITKTKSRGSVQLKSTNPFEGPLIYNNLAMDYEDRQALIRYVRFIQQLTKTPTFQYYGLELITIPLEECDNYIFDSNDYWSCYIKYFYISAWHAAGTCRMGPATDPSAVVDDHLRVHGIKGLRVIDASIMPNITSANTNGPAIMIAEKGAQLIKDDWSNNVW